jgi:HNH endonuclease
MQADLSLSFSMIDEIHSQALEASRRYKRAEAELIGILQKVDVHQVFLKRGYPSLFSYVTRELELAENVAYTLITIARKSQEVPELKLQIDAGTISISNARRVAAVLTSHDPQGNSEWLKKAGELSNRQLEKEIVKSCPQKAAVERASYVTPERIKLEIGLSEREMLRLRRVQDLLSQSKRRAVSLEETVQTLTAEFIHKHDPIEKAKRHRVRNAAEVTLSTKESARERVESSDESGAGFVQLPSEVVGELVTLRVGLSREPIPAALLHQVSLRDCRRCTASLPDGTRCNQSRWIEIHHKTPISQGGENTLENLTTLCSAHHRLWHLNHKK